MHIMVYSVGTRLFSHYLHRKRWYTPFRRLSVGTPAHLARGFGAGRTDGRARVGIDVGDESREAKRHGACLQHRVDVQSYRQGQAVEAGTALYAYPRDRPFG